MSVDGTTVTASITYGSGASAYTFTAVFENGNVTLSEYGETVGEYFKPEIDPNCCMGTYSVTIEEAGESAVKTVVVGAATDSVNDEFQPFVTVDGEEASEVKVSLNSSGLHELTFEVAEDAGVKMCIRDRF